MVNNLDQMTEKKKNQTIINLDNLNKQYYEQNKMLVRKNEELRCLVQSYKESIQRYAYHLRYKSEKLERYESELYDLREQLEEYEDQLKDYNKLKKLKEKLTALSHGESISVFHNQQKEIDRLKEENDRHKWHYVNVSQVEPPENKPLLVIKSMGKYGNEYDINIYWDGMWNRYTPIAWKYID